MTLKEIRAKNNLSLIAAAQILGISPHTLRKYENGQRLPSFKVLIKIVELYDGNFLEVTEALRVPKNRKEG